MAEKKKRFFKADNGDQYVVYDNIEDAFAQIDSESSDYDEVEYGRYKPFWEFSLIWLTQQEFEKLPEAYSSLK